MVLCPLGPLRGRCHRAAGGGRVTGGGRCWQRELARQPQVACGGLRSGGLPPGGEAVAHGHAVDLVRVRVRIRVRVRGRFRGRGSRRPGSRWRPVLHGLCRV